MIRREQLVDDLRALGIGAGDTVMVHASLRRIGPIEGGAATLVATLGEVAGTSMMTLGAIEQDEFDPQPFDALVTPADPDIGVLAEVFRTTPGTLVSDHPEGRFGARGERAAWLVADQPWHHYYGLRLTPGEAGRGRRPRAAARCRRRHDHPDAPRRVPVRRAGQAHASCGSRSSTGATVPSSAPSSASTTPTASSTATTSPRSWPPTGAAGRVRSGRVGNVEAELLDAARLRHVRDRLDEHRAHLTQL